MSDKSFDWRNAPAGPATDAKVAELRGLEFCQSLAPDGTIETVWLPGYRGSAVGEKDIPYSPTTNIVQAMELLDPVSDGLWTCGNVAAGGGSYWCACAGWYAVADTPSLAMVRAWGLAMVALATKADAPGKVKPC